MKVNRVKKKEEIKMFLIFILVVLVKAEKNDTERIVCDGVVFNHVYFDKELLFSNLGRPYNLVMHKFSGILFFSHTIQNGSQVDFAIMACHVDKRNCKDVKGVPGGYAVAYDSGNDDIYFGGHDGIYKYNFLTKSAEFFSEEGKSIWGLFVKRNFYYIEYPSQKLYVYEDDTFVKVAEAIHIEIDHFFVSKLNDIYFSNKTALYKVEKGTKDPLVLDDDIIVRQIVEDGYGDLYFCGSSGIYLEDKPFHKIKKIAHIEQAFGLTFDEHDHIIFSDKDSIYKLMLNKHSALCLEALNNSEEEEKNAFFTFSRR